MARQGSYLPDVPARAYEACCVSSKAKRPTVDERLIRWKDFAAVNRVWLKKYGELLARVKRLEEANAKAD